MILAPGFDLNLRPMKYPIFYEMYKNGIKNTHSDSDEFWLYKVI